MSATSSPSKRRGRKTDGQTGTYYKCTSCRYTSDRYYNVIRHEFRIHSASSRPRRCCDRKFSTKGDYYLHCERNHPKSRAANLISRTKYKMVPSDDESPSKFAAESRVERRTPYMLRPRGHARASWTKDEPYEDSDFSDGSSAETEDSSEDPPSASAASSRESSGYETKSSILDENQNEKMAPIDLPPMRSNEESISSKSTDSNVENETKIKVKREIGDYPRSKDESREKSFFDEAKLPESFYLPIKKRILRSIENTNRENCAKIDRSRRRIDKENEDGRVVVSADPRISWHDFTRLHREYFESLLSDRSMLDRFRYVE